MQARRWNVRALGVSCRLATLEVGVGRHGRCRVIRAEGHLEQHEGLILVVAQLELLARVRGSGTRSSRRGEGDGRGRGRVHQER